MKNFPVLGALLVIGAWSAAAQTNLQIITFTNIAGRVFQNVELRKVERDGIIWFATNGTSGGKVKFSDMAPALRERFGYDPLAERDATQQEAERKESIRQMNLAVRQAAAEKKRLEALRLKREALKGKVLQRVPDGLLIITHESDFDSEATRLFPNATRGTFVLYDKKDKHEYPYHIGTSLLVNHPGESKMADGTKIDTLLVYPDGVYEYTTVQGAKATVRRFSFTPPPKD